MVVVATCHSGRTRHRLFINLMLFMERIYAKDYEIAPLGIVARTINASNCGVID